MGHWICGPPANKSQVSSQKAGANLVHPAVVCQSQAFNILHERDPFMAIFYAYFDESGKYHDKKVVTFCGVCAPAQKMQSLEEDWNSLLRKYEMPYLHMQQALRLSKPLSKKIKAHSAPERIDALKPFADCIREHVELGIAITVDVDAYAAMSVEGRRRLGGSPDPHYLAFMSGIMGPVLYVQEQDFVSLICDDNEETAINCFQFYRRIRKLHKPAHDKLVSISFAQDKQFPALQSADFIASLVRLEAHRQFERRPYDYRELFLHLIAPGSTAAMRWGIAFYDEQRLSKMSKKLEKNPIGTKETWLHP